MRNYKNAFIVLYRSKILFVSMILLAAFVGWQASSVYGNPVVSQPLANAMTLSIYLFVIMMLVSFEYMMKLYNNGVAETLQVTGKGKRRRNYWASFSVMTTYSAIITIMIAIIVLREFVFYNIVDPNNEYKIHIIKCVILHIFMVMELAITIGLTMAAFRRRILSYVIMSVLILATCPFASTIARMISETSMGSLQPGRIAFGVISPFYIVPKLNLSFATSAAFGESLLPDRIFIILFWLCLCATIICITRKKKKWMTALCAVLSIVMIIGYYSPIAKMNDGMQVFYNDIPDWAYVLDHDNLDEKADYKITEYDMELSMVTKLSATVRMKVSKSLDTYKMTLHRLYKVSEVTDQDGNNLIFNQNEHYIEIENQDGKEITEIVMKYSGNDMFYYSNYQCCFLPGYYLYYPRAGYIPVHDKDYGYVYYNFVDENTEFRVKVDSPEKYISNLEYIDGEFRGKSDGFTLVKGFYKIEDMGNGNKFIYPYLDNFIVHDGKMSEAECWKETFDQSKAELEKDKVKDTMVFFDEALSMDQGWAYGKKQYFIQSYPMFYVSVPR